MFSWDVLWGFGIAGVVIGASIGSLLFFGRRALAREECYRCHQNMGVRYDEMLVKSAPDGKSNIYRRFRVCRHCGARSQSREFARRKPSK